MWRLLLLIALAGSGLLQASQTVKKIEESKKTLQNTEAKKKRMSRQLNKLAASIKQTEKELAKLQKILDRLEKKKREGETKYAGTLQRIEGLDKQIGSLDRNIRKRHEEFIRLLTDQFSTIVAMR